MACAMERTQNAEHGREHVASRGVPSPPVGADPTASLSSSESSSIASKRWAGDMEAPVASETQISHAQLEQALAGFVERMEPARPDLIQAVHAFQALQYFGRVLRLPDAPRQRVSHQVSRIDEFWSHSWHGSQWCKILTALYLQTGMKAAVLATIASIVVMMVVSSGFLPIWRFVEDPPYPENSWWCTGLSFVVYILVLLGFRPTQTIFLDVLCIDQQDNDEKAMGILSMGAFLKISDAMFVLWDASYTHRLWCVFEMAAFMHSHRSAPGSRLTIRPTILGPCFVSLPVALSCFVLAVGWIPWMALEKSHAIIWPIMGLFFFIGFYVSVAGMRSYFRSVQMLDSELENFCAESGLCYCCSNNHVGDNGQPIACDRKVVLHCITAWFGSVSSFEEKVRTEVRDCLKDQLSKEIFTYARCVATGVPVLWHFLDSAATRANFRVEDFEIVAAREVIRGIGWVFGVIPVALIVSARLMSLCWRKRERMVCEVLTNCCILALVFVVLLGALVLEVVIWRFDRAFFDVKFYLLPGSAIFTSLTVSMAAMLFCCIARCRRAPSPSRSVAKAAL